MRKSSLPHYYDGHSTFFITFRLVDSLPQSKLNELKNNFQNDVNKIVETDPNIRNQIIEDLKNKYFKNFEHQLDAQKYGSCVLKNEDIAQILYDKILDYHQIYYDLKCLSIMPNHVHLIFSAFDNEQKPQISKWLQLIKGGSAFLINKKLNREGKLWAAESFDRYIRNPKHYTNSFNYVINNPDSAKLDNRYKEKPYLYRCDLNEEY